MGKVSNCVLGFGRKITDAVGIGGKGSVGTDTSTIQWLFLLPYSGDCKGCCGVSCSSIAAQITAQFQKWKQKVLSFSSLKSMVLSNCCYLGDE